MSPLFSLQLQHGYFADGVCRALSVAPTRACSTLLARYGLVFRARHGSAAVYFQEDVSPLAQWTETAPLSFWLINHDPALPIYTDHTVNNSDGLFYFDNLHCKPKSSTRLASGRLAAPRLRALPARFGLPVNPSLRAAELALFHALPGTQNAVWQAQSSDALLATLPLDFSAQPEGRYRLTGNGKDLLDFWLGQPPANAWGVVAIYPGGLSQAAIVPAAARVLNRQGDVNAKTFSIELAARSMCWRYHLIGATEIDFAQYQLLASHPAGDPVNFDGAAGDPVDGLPSYCFTARQPLPLVERPGDQVSVRLAPLPHTRAQLSVNLAYPRPGNICDAQDGQSYADVFVYL